MVIAARPETKNLVSDFASAIVNVAAASTKGTLVSASFDGLDAPEVRTMMRDFLEGNSSIVGTTDANHNIKNFRYQLIGAPGGGGVTTIGDYAIDTGLLQLAGVHHELYRVKDYASDLLVLNANVE